MGAQITYRNVYLCIIITKKLETNINNRRLVKYFLKHLYCDILKGCHK